MPEIKPAGQAFHETNQRAYNDYALEIAAINAEIDAAIARKEYMCIIDVHRMSYSMLSTIKRLYEQAGYTVLSYHPKILIDPDAQLILDWYSAR